MGRRRVLPRRLRLRGPRGGRRRRAAVDGDDVDAELAAGVGPRLPPSSRHRRTARREQPLGVRRPALLGRRGRLLHQRLDGGQRAVARADVSGIVDWFLEHRLPDGGWNCEWVEGSTRSVPLDAQRAQGTARLRPRDRRHRATRAARRSGEEYLLSAGCSAGCRRRAGGTVGRPLAYPMWWRYTVLNAAEYFRQGRCSTVCGRTLGWPTRSNSSVRPAARRHLAAGDALPGRVWFDVDVPAGERSKRLMLYGFRVLDWWDRLAQPRDDAAEDHTP